MSTNQNFCDMTWWNSVCVPRLQYREADYNQMLEKMVWVLRWKMHLVAVSLSFRREGIIFFFGFSLSEIRVKPTYKFRSKIKFMIPCSPNPRLISSIPLYKSSPCIPPSIIMEWIVIWVWETPQKQECLSLLWIWFIMGECNLWIMCLTKIPCSMCSRIEIKIKPRKTLWWKHG